MKKAISFDDAIKMNATQYEGISPLNLGSWYGVLYDLVTTLYKWECPNLSFFDLLNIERFICDRIPFALVRSKFKVGSAIVYGRYHIFQCQPIIYGMNNYEVTKLRVIVQRPPVNMLLEYNYGEFVFFYNWSKSYPKLLVAKYSQMLSKLDALYMQNVEKVGLPLIALTNGKNQNDILNIFKRGENNAVFTMVNKPEHGQSKQTVTEIFYNPQSEYLLDKLNAERVSIMQEFIKQSGVNPVTDILNSTHYVNNAVSEDASLVAKFFANAYNRFRDNFKESSNEWAPELGLDYMQAINTSYQEGELNKNDSKF